MEISATVIQASISEAGKEIYTLECIYPRFIHSELMTHRVFSRNAASSRAIPIEKMMKQVSEDPAMPVSWGLNQAGMQANKEHKNTATCVYAWKQAAKSAVRTAKTLQDLGLHKQIVNRVLEPFQMMKTVITSTEWDNFFELRAHKDAQPEIKYLAEEIEAAISISIPMKIRMGELHVPYVGRYRFPEYENILYYTLDGTEEDLTDEQALMISSSCCAQVSYRLLDQSLEKALTIYDKLINAKPIHASPFEHQATPHLYTHIKSNNFRGWLQNREVLDEDYRNDF